MKAPDRMRRRIDAPVSPTGWVFRGVNIAVTMPSFIRSHRRAAVLTFVTVFIAILAIGSMSFRGYLASADLWLDRGRSVDGAVRQGVRAAEVARNTELRLLTSRDLAAQAVDALGLERVTGFGWQPKQVSMNSDGGRAAAVRAVQKQLSVYPIDQSYAVRLRFLADQPVIAAAIVNRIADLYVEDRRKASASGGDSARFAAATATEAREAMLRSEAAIVAYQSAIALLGTGERLADSPQGAASLNAELALARTGAAADRARAARDAGVATVRLRQLERRQAQRAVEGDVTSAAVDQQIDLQRSRLDQIGAQLRAADARLRLASRMRDQARNVAVKIDRSTAELARLRNVANIARNRHTQALAELARQTAAQVEDRSTAYVITRASPQSVQQMPEVWLLTVTALIIAIAASALLTFALDCRVTGFKSVVAVERALATNVLAVVPDLFDLRHQSGALDRLAVPDYLVKIADSSFAELFRGLVATLLQGEGRKEPTVIAISSALPDEGKTTVALCLARSAAIGGQRTVLIDCDLRRPAASRALFGVLAIGLIEVIEDGADLFDALKNDPGSPAMVLGVGDRQRERPMALDARALSSLISRLKGMFDVVICDCPPALALSEAREATALADSVLLVVRHRMTPTDAVIIAQDMLKRVGAHIAGVALTMVRD